MAAYKLVVLSEPMPGREDEYNRWYNEVHLREVVATPGFVSAQRFKLNSPMSGQYPHQYLAIYDVETESAEAVLAALYAAAEPGKMNISTALNVESAIAGLFEPISAVVSASASATA